MDILEDQILVRRDTLADWQNLNPTLGDGELAWVSDTHDLIAGPGAFNDVWAAAQSIPNRAKASADAAAASAAQAAVLASRSEAVRMTAAKLPAWTKKRQLAALGQSPARVLCVGDSTTAGVYSDSYGSAAGTPNQGGPNSYPSRLAAFLNARGVPAAVGMAIPGHSGNDDSRWSGPSAKNYSGSNIGAGAAAGISMTAAGHSVTLTPGVKADTFLVYYYGDSGTGVMSGQATGGSATSINTGASSTPSVKTATVVGGTPSATNSITLSWTSGTVFILGVEFYDSTNPNTVRVLPAGVGGSQATQWANLNTANQFGGRAFIKAVAPDLTVVSLGINDAAAGRTGSQVMADVTTLAGDAAVSGDVLLMSAFPHPSASTVDDVNAAYFASTYAYLDLAWRYGYNMMAWGLMTSDQTHPNALGYSDAASVLARHL